MNCELFTKPDGICNPGRTVQRLWLGGNVADGIANPVRPVISRPACDIPSGLKRAEMLRTGLQIPSGL